MSFPSKNDSWKCNYILESLSSTASVSHDLVGKVVDRFLRSRFHQNRIPLQYIYPLLARFMKTCKTNKKTDENLKNAIAKAKIASELRRKWTTSDYVGKSTKVTGTSHWSSRVHPSFCLLTLIKHRRQAPFWWQLQRLVPVLGSLASDGHFLLWLRQTVCRCRQIKPSRARLPETGTSRCGCHQ